MRIRQVLAMEIQMTEKYLGEHKIRQVEISYWFFQAFEKS